MGSRVARAAVAVTIAATAAVAAPTHANAQPVPVVEASVQQDRVAAHGLDPGAALTFELLDTDGVTLLAPPIGRTADPGGNAMVLPNEHGQNLEPGHVVRLTSGTTTKEVTLVALTMTSVDPTANTVSGTATDGTLVGVDANEGPTAAHLDDTADATDTWSVDFDGHVPAFDVSFASFVTARVAEPDGDATFSSANPRTVEASPAQDNVAAHGFAPGSTLTFELLAADGVTPLTAPFDRTADSGGNAFAWGFEHGQNLEPGHVARVTGGGVTKTLTLVDVAITAIDPGENTVSGTAPAGQPVNVDANSPNTPSGAHLETSASGAGNWSVDFDDAAPPLDLTFGHALFVRANEFGPGADGDGTVATAGPAGIDASEQQDTVSVRGYPAGASLTFDLLHADGVTPLTGPIVRLADAFGNAFIGAGDHGQNLLADHVVRVSGGPIVKQLTLAALALTGVDFGQNTVSGTATALSPVAVDAFNPPLGQFARMETTADGSGNWTVDFDNATPAPFDLTFSTPPTARVQETGPGADGDATVAGFNPSAIDGSPQDDTASAHQFPGGATLTFEFFEADGTTPLRSPVVRVADPTGNAFVGGEDLGVDLLPGQVLRVTAGSTVKEVTLEPLAITGINAADNIVSGTSAPGAAVSVNVNDPPGPNGSFRDTTADGSGNWSVDLDLGGPVFDITGFTHANARVNETGPSADGDGTVAHRGPRSIDANPGQDWINGNGFNPGSTVTLTVFEAAGGAQLFSTTTPVEPGGFFFVGLDPGQPGQDLVTGRHVRAEPVGDPGGAKELTIADLAITRVDFGADEIEGTSDPGITTIHLNVDKPAHHVFQSLTPVGGVWLFEGDTLLPPFDVDGTTHVNARALDPDGDGTVADIGPPRVGANPRSDWLNLSGFTPGPLTLRILAAPAGPELFSTTVFTDLAGNLFYELDREDPNQDLSPGRHVEVSAGSTVKELTVADVAITAMLASDNTVRGSAEAGALRVTVGSDSGPGAEINIDNHPGGPWAVDFDTVSFDIVANSFANASLPDADGDTTVDGTGAASVHVEPEFDDVHIHHFPSSTALTVRLLDAAGDPAPEVLTVTTDPEGFAFVGSESHTTDLVIGSVVEVALTADPTIAKSVTVEPLAITLVNPVDNTVRGTAGVGREVSVSFDFNENSPLTDVADDGTWLVDFDDAFNLGGAFATASVLDQDGDSTRANREAAGIRVVPRYSRHNGFSELQLEWFPGESTSTVEVFADATLTGPPRYTGVVHTDQDGMQCCEELPIALLSGNVVRVSEPTFGLVKTLEVIDLSITHANPTTDVVTGTAPTGSEVFVQPFNDEEPVLATFTGPDQWEAAFPDISDGQGFGLGVFDEDHDAVQAGKSTPNVQASITDDRIDASGFAPDVPVTFDIYLDRDDPDPAFSGERMSDSGGAVSLTHERHSQDLVGGRYVVVSDGTVTRDVELLPVTIAVDPDTPDPANPEHYGIFGTADPAFTLFVSAGSPEGGGQVCGFCPVDPDGTWSLPVSVFSAGARSSASASSHEADLDGTVAEKPIPNITADPAANVLRLRGFLPGEPVTVEILGAGGSPSLFGPTVFTAAADGTLALGFGHHGVDIGEGHVVEASGGVTGWDLAMTVGTVTFDALDSATNVASGTGTPDSKVIVTVDNEASGSESVAFVDGAGNWAVDFTGVLDVVDGAQGRVALEDGESINVTIARAGVATEVGTGGGTVSTDPEGDGATPADPVETSVSVAPGGSGGTVEVTETEFVPEAPTPEGFTFLDQQVEIEAPPATATAPLEISFVIDAIQFPPGDDATTVQVFKDGVLVGECAVLPPSAISPDPCISERTTLPDGDGRITVLTSTASVWSFAVTPPEVLSLDLSRNPKRTTQTSTVTAFAADAGSGISGGELFVGADPGAGNATPMNVRPCAAPCTAPAKLTATIGTLPAGLYTVGVRATDGTAWSETATTALVVYDTSASVSGDGRIAGPGNFKFDVKYKKSTSTTPSGSVTFTAGSFKLKSTGLNWLVVTGNVATFEGTAKLGGQRHVFRVIATDGSPDRFELRVWAPGDDPNHDAPVHEFTGDLTRGRISVGH